MDTRSNVSPALMGAAGGAVVLALIGFTWGGWVTQSKAQSLAKLDATTAVVAALAPICLNQFQRAPDALARQVELQKLGMSEQGSYVEKAGWATMPGAAAADPAVARSCAGMISTAKL